MKIKKKDLLRLMGHQLGEDCARDVFKYVERNRSVRVAETRGAGGGGGTGAAHVQAPDRMPETVSGDVVAPLLTALQPLVEVAKNCRAYGMTKGPLIYGFHGGAILTREQCLRVEEVVEDFNRRVKA